MRSEPLLRLTSLRSGGLSIGGLEVGGGREGLLHERTSGCCTVLVPKYLGIQEGQPFPVVKDLPGRQPDVPGSEEGNVHSGRVHKLVAVRSGAHAPCSPDGRTITVSLSYQCESTGSGWRLVSPSRKSL